MIIYSKKIRENGLEQITNFVYATLIYNTSHTLHVLKATFIEGYNHIRSIFLTKSCIITYYCVLNI